MVAISAVFLFLLSFIAPIVVLLFLADRNKTYLKFFIYGIITYIIAETCIKLPVLRLFGYGETGNVGYMLLLTVVAAFFIETVRYFVLKANIKKQKFLIGKLSSYSAGFILAYIFIVWGIDSLFTAAVVVLDDFKLITVSEIWDEIIAIVEIIPIQFGLMLLCANAVRFKQREYFFLAIIIRIVTEPDLIFMLCSKFSLGSGVGILYLAIICVIIIMFVKRQIIYWRGDDNENIETNEE